MRCQADLSVECQGVQDGAAARELHDVCGIYDGLAYQQCDDMQKIKEALVQALSDLC